MALQKRLFNVARIEATRAAYRFRAAAQGLFEVSRAQPAETLADAEYARIRAEIEAELAREVPLEPTRAPKVFPEAVRRFYANLELPVGASAEDVRGAYRRLMRRYHPDKHSADPERARAANRLAHELRQAYEGILRHLGEV